MPTDAPLAKAFATIDGYQMAYHERGAGDPILFLHGNPTSSYLWRDIIPHMEDLGRIIAPDLIGMGDSEKLSDSGPGRYTFKDHRHYLDGLIDHLIGEAGNVTLVIHDWGSALGFHWAHRHPDRVKGIVYMEAIVAPVSWDDWPEQARKVFQGFRSEAGEEMVLQKNIFVERVLPSSILRDLSDAQMAEYLKPFADAGEGRRPTLTWPRQIPIEGEPADVHQIVADYSNWLRTSDVPKLFIDADPGSILVGRQRDLARTFPNQSEVTVKGLHFIQEDSPDEIGQAVADWLRNM